ncbi:MAG: hypothetical protein JWO36_4936 [Myxococcales bacterium]|nr:hypothetical protein [Myxococcales bacterium]
MIPIPTTITTLINYGLLALVLWAINRASLRNPSPLYLQVEGRSVSGICMGIARTLEVPVGLVRAAFVAAALVGAHAFIAYLVLELTIHWDPMQRPQIWSNRLWGRLRGAGTR